MSPSQDFAEPVRQVCEALQALIGTTSQLERAHAIGLRCHTQVSNLEAMVTRGERDSYLTAYGPARIILLLKSFPQFKAALDAAVSPVSEPADAARCERDLLDVASTCARSIEAIVQRLPKGMTPQELAECDEQLGNLQGVLHRARRDIARAVRNRQGGD